MVKNPLFCAGFVNSAKSLDKLIDTIIIVNTIGFYVMLGADLLPRAPSLPLSFRPSQHRGEGSSNN